MTKPLISVVMPSYRQVAYIDEAIRSVLDQDYPGRELIVMDGGSEDGSVDIIRQHADHLAYWTSGRDGGQSEAIHRGFSHARGELLCWVNSDDILLPGTLSAAAAEFDRLGGSDWIAGNCIWLDPTGHLSRCSRGLRWSDVLARFGQVNVSAPSSFFSPKLYQAVGGLDHDLHYMMDTDLWLRFAKYGARFARISRYLWGLRLHPEAKMSGHNFADSAMAQPNHPVWAKRRNEASRIAERYGIDSRKVQAGRVLSRAYRTACGASAHAWLDCVRWRGRHWSEIG